MSIMDGPGLYRALRELGWTRSELARRLGASNTYVTYWGYKRMPPAVAEWLVALCEHAKKAPPAPEHWRKCREKPSNREGAELVVGPSLLRSPRPCNPDADEPNYYGDHGDTT